MSDTVVVVLDDYFSFVMQYRESGKVQARWYRCMTCSSTVCDFTGDERREHFEFHKREGHTMFVKRTATKGR